MPYRAWLGLFSVALAVSLVGCSGGGSGRRSTPKKDMSSSSQDMTGEDPVDMAHNATPDMTTKQDAGTTKKADGEACTAASQCAGGFCDTTKTSTGYCTHDCTSDETCPGGGLPVGDGSGNCQCLSACTNAGDCRAGLECILLTSGSGACDGPVLANCDPKTGTGSCTTTSGSIITPGLPGGCMPFGQVLDGSGAEKYTGLCLPSCVPGDSVCGFASGAQCELDDNTTLKSDTGTLLGFKWKGSVCVLPSSPTVQAGGSCGGATQTTTCAPGLTCDPVATTGQTCQTMCTYNSNGSVDTSCASGVCTDVLGLGSSTSFPTGVCIGG